MSKPQLLGHLQSGESVYKYPESELNSSAIASADLDEMSTLEYAKSIITDTAAAAANVAGKIGAVVGVIQSATKYIETVTDSMEGIYSEINSMIDDVGGNITQLLFATQRLMRAPARLQDNTLNKINTYSQMASDIISAIKDDKESSPTNLKNNAILIQAFAGYAVGCTGEAALYTTFNIRTDIIAVIETLTESLDNYNTALSDARTDDNLINEYSGDHNFQLFLFGSYIEYDLSTYGKLCKFIFFTIQCRL